MGEGRLLAIARQRTSGLILILWDLMGLTAHMGSSNEMLVSVEVKPQPAKKTVNAFETIRTSGNGLEFVVEPFDKTAVGSPVEIAGNISQVVTESLEKSVKTVERAAFNFGGPLFQTTLAFSQLQVHVEDGGQLFAQGVSLV